MSQRRSFTRRDALLFAGLGVAATLLTPARLFADPQSDLEAASAQLDSLGAALAEAMDNLNEKTYALDATNNKIGEVQEQIAETTNQLNQQRLVLSAAMRSAYKAGPQETLDFLLGASSPEDFVSRVYYMDRTSKQEADSINTVKALGDQLQAQQLELQAEQENLQAQVAEMKTTADGLQSQVAEAKAYYDSLDAEVKAQLAAQEAASANNNVSYAIETVTRENPSNSSESNDSPLTVQIQTPALRALATPVAVLTLVVALTLVVGLVQAADHTPAVVVAVIQPQAAALPLLMLALAIHTFGVELLLLLALTVVVWSITASLAIAQVLQEPLDAPFVLLATGTIPWMSSIMVTSSLPVQATSMLESISAVVA